MLNLEQVFSDINHNKQTDFQNIHFVVEKSGITLWGKYCQAARELKGRIESYKKILINIKETEIKILSIQQSIKYYNENQEFCNSELYSASDDKDIFINTIELDSLGKARKELDLIRLEDEFNELTLQREAVKNSIELFYKTVFYLRTELEKEGKLTNERKLELEKDFWYNKFKQQIAFELTANKTMSSNLIENICSLPSEIKSNLLKEISSPKSISTLVDNVINNINSKELNQTEIKSLEMDISKLDNYLEQIETKYLT